MSQRDKKVPGSPSVSHKHTSPKNRGIIDILKSIGPRRILNPSHFSKERDRESTVPTIHQLKPAISPKLSAAERLPEVPLLWGRLENEHLGQPELLIGGRNDRKCHNAPFQIKRCPDFSGREAGEENGPEYLRHYCIFFSWTPTIYYKRELVTSKVSGFSCCSPGVSQSLLMASTVVLFRSFHGGGQRGIASVHQESEDFAEVQQWGRTGIPWHHFYCRKPSPERKASWEPCVPKNLTGILRIPHYTSGLISK